jgi:hypothetical protein
VAAHARGLAAALLAADALAPGTVRLMTVEHDTDCGLWRGRACDCEPDMVKVGPPVRREARPQPT